MRRPARSATTRPLPQTPPARSTGGTVLGLFIGLILGVGIAAGVVWYLNKAPMPFFGKTQTGSSESTPQPPHKPSTTPAPEPLSLPGKPGDPLPEKRFQFYDILPGKTDAVPEKPVKESKEAPPPDESRKEDNRNPTLLQAGAFTKAQEADNLKARLALFGVEATIQQVMVQDQTFYRVRLGPYSRLDEVNRVRAELARAGIDTAIVKKE